MQITYIHHEQLEKHIQEKLTPEHFKYLTISGRQRRTTAKTIEEMFRKKHMTDLLKMLDMAGYLTAVANLKKQPAHEQV